MSTLVYTASFADSTSTGRSPPRRISERSTEPSTWGSIRSSTTSSRAPPPSGRGPGFGASAARSRRAASPSWALSTSCPAASSVSTSRACTSGESSTTRMRAIGSSGRGGGQEPQVCRQRLPAPGRELGDLPGSPPCPGDILCSTDVVLLGARRPARQAPCPADAARHRPRARETRAVPTAERGRALSTLSFVLILLAAALAVASVAGIYITNVTAKPGGIPRWVVYLFLATLVVGLAAVLSLA